MLNQTITGVVYAQLQELGITFKPLSAPTDLEQQFEVAWPDGTGHAPSAGISTKHVYVVEHYVPTLHGLQTVYEKRYHSLRSEDYMYSSLSRNLEIVMKRGYNG